MDGFPSSVLERRSPGVYTAWDDRAARRGLPANRQSMALIGQRLSALVEPARFAQGGTLNDLTSGGTFTGTAKTDIVVKITTAAATDKFKLSTDGGATFGAEVLITGAAQALGDGITGTFGAVTGHAIGDTWAFSAWPEPSVVEAVVKRLYKDSEAAQYFGSGSVAHLMARAAYAASSLVDLHTIALDDAGAAVAAQGSLTVVVGGDAATAVASGNFRLCVGITAVNVGFSVGATAQDISYALQAALAKQSHLLPATQAVDAATPAKLGFTAKNKGTLGNAIHIGAEITDGTGVSATIVAMTGGATDPDIATALAVLAPTQYHFRVPAWNDATTLAALRAEINTLDGPTVQRETFGVFGSTGAIADAATLSLGLNSLFLGHQHFRLSSATARHAAQYEVSSAVCAIACTESDPAVPLDYVEIPGLPPQALGDRLTPEEAEDLLWQGVSPIVTLDDGRVVVYRAITTYLKDAQGVADDLWLDIGKPRTLSYVRKAIRTATAPILVKAKKTEAKRRALWSETYRTLKALEKEELVERVDEYKDRIIIENVTGNAGGLTIKVPAAIIEGLHNLFPEIEILRAE